MDKKSLLSVVLIILIIMVCSINFNNELKKTSKSVTYNGEGLQISVDGELTSTLPTSGTYYLTDYSCNDNNTKLVWDNVNYELVVKNDVGAGVSCSLVFNSQELLSNMKVGDYVAYTGNNGCTKCDGGNSADNQYTGGYCGDQEYRFVASGWRIAYFDRGNTYLISAGATDCMCTGSDGAVSSSSCSDYLTTSDLGSHYSNMNTIALKYCNTTYADDGVCDGTTAWAMNANDFGKITNATLASNTCIDSYGIKGCGYANDLIDNGGYYWFATKDELVRSNATFIWNPNGRTSSSAISSYTYGVRPVIKLDQRVVVTGGIGTADDPYVLGYDAKRDTVAPICTVEGPTGTTYNGYIKNGNTLTYKVTCTDNSKAFVSSQLTVSDFTSSDTGVMTVTNVSEPTAVYGGYSWDVTVTAGASTGSATLSLNAGAMSDYMGNNNAMVTSGDSVNTDNTAPTCGSTTYSTTSATTGSVTAYVSCTDNLSGCVNSSYSKSLSSNGSGSITIADKVGNTNSCSYSVSNIYRLSISSYSDYSNFNAHCNTKYWYESKYVFSITATGYGVSSGKMCFAESSGATPSSSCGYYATSGKNSGGVACFDSSTSWTFYRSGGCVYAYVCNSAGRCTDNYACT